MSKDRQLGSLQEKNTIVNQTESSILLGNKLQKFSTNINSFKKKGQQEDQSIPKVVLVSPGNEKSTSCFNFFKLSTTNRNSEITPLTSSSAPESKGFGYKT